MREIKFRIWDNLEKQFVQNLMLNTDGFLFDAFKETTPYFAVNSERYGGDPNRYIVDFFTGLKDKNGVEIYEGDIIPKYTHFDNMVSKDFIKECKYPEEIGKAFFKVIWNVRQCAFQMVLRKFTKNEPLCKILSVYSGENSEVIGNIHDNPELLKNK